MIVPVPAVAKTGALISTCCVSLAISTLPARPVERMAAVGSTVSSTANPWAAAILTALFACTSELTSIRPAGVSNVTVPSTTVTGEAALRRKLPDVAFAETFPAPVTVTSSPIVTPVAPLRVTPDSAVTLLAVDTARALAVNATEPAVAVTLPAVATVPLTDVRLTLPVVVESAAAAAVETPALPTSVMPFAAVTVAPNAAFPTVAVALIVAAVLCSVPPTLVVSP